MRAVLRSLFVFNFLTTGVIGADRQDQLFASWQKAQRGVESLVVRFTLETTDFAFKQRQKADGTFRLLRTTKGEVFASYEVTEPQAKCDKQERYSCLLNQRTIYLLDHDKKTAIAIRFESSEGDLLRFLEQYFNPFVLLLDQRRASAQWQFELT
jgi:hypothetical protein